MSLVKTLESMAKDVRKAMIVEFCGEDDMTGECEQASIILWKYVKDIELVNPNENKVALGYFKGEGHFWNIINGIYVDITVDQFGEYSWGVVSEDKYCDYSIEKYMDYSNDISLLNIADDFLSHIKM